MNWENVRVGKSAGLTAVYALLLFSATGPVFASGPAEATREQAFAAIYKIPPHYFAARSLCMGERSTI